MLCKWCGMESATTERCSWCHRALSTSTNEDETEPQIEQAETPVSLAVVETSHAGPEKAPPSGGQAAEAAQPIAPWTVSPPAPSAAPPASSPMPSADGDNKAARPIIGVRRPGGPGGHMPAPAMPSSRPPAPARFTEAAQKPASAGGSTGRPHIPAPAMPSGAPAIGVNRAGSGSVPSQQPHVPAPAMPAGMPRQPLNAPDQTAPAAGGASSRPAIPATLRAPNSPAVQAGASNGSAGLAPASLAQTAVHAEPAGLAQGVAANRAPAAPTLPVEENVPALGTFPTVASKYYSNQVVDPVSGTHYDVETGKATTTPVPATKKSEPKIVLNWDDPVKPASSQLGKWGALFAGMLLLAGLIAHMLPEAYAVPMFLTEFAAALFLPIMKIVPWADEDADHIWFFVILTLAVGPLAGLIIYGFFGLLRQDVNPAILGCLSIALVARVVCEAAAGHFSIAGLQPFTTGHFDWRQMLIGWSGLWCMAGWYTASIFRKLDE